MRKLAAPHSSKRCPGCGIDKPASDFWISRTTASGLAGKCKACSKAASYAWRERNPERARAIDQRWQDKHGRRRQLARRYGITVAEYEAMVAAQKGACALCLRPETTKLPSGAVALLCVDHDHLTGRIRGLLCRNCNSALDRIPSDPDGIQRLIAYLAAS